MNKIDKQNNDEYNLLMKQISVLIADAKRRIAATVNETLVETYWHVGKYMFYIRFPIFQTLSGKLSCSHIIEIVNIDVSERSEQ